MPEPQNPHVIHFAPGLVGTVRWMGYWTWSRSVNASRAARLLWHSQVLPEWSILVSRFTSNSRAAASRVRGADGVRPFTSASESTRRHGLSDVHA